MVLRGYRPHCRNIGRAGFRSALMAKKLVIEGPVYDQSDHARDAMSAANYAELAAGSAILRNPATENRQPTGRLKELFPKNAIGPLGPPGFLNKGLELRLHWLPQPPALSAPT